MASLGGTAVRGRLPGRMVDGVSISGLIVESTSFLFCNR